MQKSDKYIVKVHYGLGNQLFQYAFAKSMACKTGKTTLLDNSFYKNHQQDKHPRFFALSNFNISLKIVDDDKKMNGKISILQKILRKIERSFFPYYKQSIVFEKGSSYDNKIWKARDASYLIGYWQDERYFKDIEEVIRKDLSFREGPSKKNESLYSEIISLNNTICIHVRRGDYITDKFIQSKVGICSEKYYKEAFDKLSTMMINPKVYVFSDDPEWVSANFNINYPITIVNINSEAEATEDLRLMAACKHAIISNSSFGWWAGWLNNNSDKIVIAPKIWRIVGTDMYTPESWFRI